MKAPSANDRAVLFRKSMVGVDVVYKSLVFRKAAHAPLNRNQYFCLGLHSQWFVLVQRYNDIWTQTQ